MADQPVSPIDVLRQLGRTAEALADLLEKQREAAAPADDLVPISTKEDVARFGLELKAVRHLVATGKLRAVEIGRKRFTKRSYLLALVDELPAAASKPAASNAPGHAVETHDDLAEAVLAAAKRKAKRSAA